MQSHMRRGSFGAQRIKTYVTGAKKNELRGAVELKLEAELKPLRGTVAVNRH
jgi:hypothetical protein